MANYCLDGPTHNFQWSSWRIVRVRKDPAMLRLEISHAHWPGIHGALSGYFAGLGLRLNGRNGGFRAERPIEIWKFLMLHSPSKEVRLAATWWKDAWHKRLLIRGVVVPLDRKIETERAARALLDLLPSPADPK